jgi:hypothetical protein
VREEEATVWSAADRRRIAAEGLTVPEVDRQLALIRGGVHPIRLNRACRVGDGIQQIPSHRQENVLARYEDSLSWCQFIKFVPASGAATRMFREWYLALQAGGFPPAVAERFLKGDLSRYPFFPDLKAVLSERGQDLDALIKARDSAAILRTILTEDGLNYGQLPKALLAFHLYPGGARSALEEHLVEAALYARDADKRARLHFTVSPEHAPAVQRRLSQVTGPYEGLFDTRFCIGLSFQDPATNSLAVDASLQPWRSEQGELVFRPGGHGALLANLAALDADVVFLKNIDNCVPDRLKGETVLWKKLLAGCLLGLQSEIFAALRRLEKGASGTEVGRIAAFCGEAMQLAEPPGLATNPLAERCSWWFQRLNRPLRVCGVVRNEGESGGGPFWVEDPEAGEIMPQIVEETQIDRESATQQAVWTSATHFNPVDLVCGIRDFRGNRFSLQAFADPRTATLVRKSERGRDLIALERPGLWNGSMAFWNTVFVEVPLATFNPVKNVLDLLRPQHLPVQPP